MRLVRDEASPAWRASCTMPIAVSGGPWNTLIAVGWHETNSGTDNVRTYNRGIHVVHPRWGRATADHLPGHQRSGGDARPLVRKPVTRGLGRANRWLTALSVVAAARQTAMSKPIGQLIHRFTKQKPFPGSVWEFLGGAPGIGFKRHFVFAIAATCLLMTEIGSAHAAGAFAVGACGAYGYGFDFRNVADAASLQ